MNSVELETVRTGAESNVPSQYQCNVTAFKNFKVFRCCQEYNFKILAFVCLRAPLVVSLSSSAILVPSVVLLCRRTIYARVSFFLLVGLLQRPKENALLHFVKQMMCTRSYAAHAVVLAYYLNHCARTFYSRRIVTRCRCTNWPIRSERGAEPCIFLAPIWFAFGCHAVLFWSWLPGRGRWTAPVDSEIRRKMCEMLGISAMKGYQVKALQLYASANVTRWVCLPNGSRKSVCFEAIRSVIDHVTARERAASIVRRLLLAWFVLV